MKHETARLQLISLAGGIHNHEWLRKLSYRDQPRLFSRYSHVEFLRGIPVEERCALALGVLLEWVLSARAYCDANSIAMDISGGIDDFESFYRGEAALPCFALQVFPGAQYVYPDIPKSDQPTEEVHSWLRMTDYFDRFDVFGWGEADWPVVHLYLR